jgi:hypothetical protein
MTGGGSGINTIEDLARAALRLPSKIGTLPVTSEGKAIKDASWAVAYGLTIWGFTGDGTMGRPNGFSTLFKGLGRSLQNIVKPLLP